MTCSSHPHVQDTREAKGEARLCMVAVITGGRLQTEISYCLQKIHAPDEDR